MKNILKVLSTIPDNSNLKKKSFEIDNKFSLSDVNHLFTYIVCSHPKDAKNSAVQFVPMKKLRL